MSAIETVLTRKTWVVGSGRVGGVGCWQAMRRQCVDCYHVSACRPLHNGSDCASAIAVCRLLCCSVVT